LGVLRLQQVGHVGIGGTCGYSLGNTIGAQPRA
jgi:hypothetical protein